MKQRETLLRRSSTWQHEDLHKIIDLRQKPPGINEVIMQSNKAVEQAQKESMNTFIPGIA